MARMWEFSDNSGERAATLAAVGGSGGGGRDISDPTLLSGADKEDTPPPLMADSALPTRLNKADMNLMTAALAEPSRPRILPSIANPAIRRPDPPPSL